MSTFGPAFSAPLDGKRIGEQMTMVLAIMQDGRWRTLEEIERATDYPQASISAQLRHLRKEEFGAFVVEKRRRAGLLKTSFGTWEYRVLPPKPVKDGQQMLLECM